MGLKRKTVAGAILAGLIPVAGVVPAEASFKHTDTKYAQITFHDVHGNQLTCRAGGITSYEFPRPGTSDDAHIEASAGVYNDPSFPDDPRCRDALYQVSLSGRYETAPGSGVYRTFRSEGAPAVGSAPAAWATLIAFDVAGPTGSITVSNQALFGCADPPACGFLRLDGQHPAEVTLRAQVATRRRQTCLPSEPPAG